jgi:hypothetical protein
MFEKVASKVLQTLLVTMLGVRYPNAQGLLTPKDSDIYIILYLIYMYDSHIVAMTHSII